MNAPIFTINAKTIDLVAQIAEKLGELRASGKYVRNLRLRKINRLRSIQSSLAIENNTLSLEQVTDIIEGKRVLGSPSEIQEVKNAYQALEELPNKNITDIFTDINTDKLSKTELEFLEQIAAYLDKNGEITNYRARLLTNKSDISVKKYLARFAEIGLLKIEGKNKGRKYKIIAG